MRLMRDWSDEELTEVLLEDDERSLQQFVTPLPGALRVLAERPQVFWSRQQAAIRGRIAEREHASPLTMAARVAAAALALVAIFLLQSRPAHAPVPLPAQSDQQLLLSVERSVHRDVPQALEPAALLADDIFRSASANQHSPRSAQGEP